MAFFSSNNTVQLEPYWWTKYTLDDAPLYLVNPHFRSVWEQSTPDRQDIALMAIGMFKETNSKRREVKFNLIKERMAGYGIYMPLTYREFASNFKKSMPIIAAATMEIYTPSGLYLTPIEFI